MNKFEYKNLTPFKWFVLENFPFIEADFDALTEWQLFCKIGKEMNKIINNENKLGLQMETVTNAFIELQNYVNNYFDNLDLQEEVNKKLNEMAEDGTLSKIINQEIFGELNNKLNNKQDKNMPKSNDIDFERLGRIIDETHLVNNHISGYYGMQGGTLIDENTFAFISNHHSSFSEDTDDLSLIRKIDLNTGDVLSQKPVEIGHANGFLYDKFEHKFYVAPAHSNVNANVNASVFSNKIIILDENFNIIQTNTTNINFDSLSLDEEGNLYGGVTYKSDLINGQKIYKLNKNDFSVENTITLDFPIPHTLGSGQDFTIYDNKIYYLQYSPNAIFVFDMDGNYIITYKLENKGFYNWGETENINSLGNGKFIIGTHWQPTGNLYDLEQFFVINVLHNQPIINNRLNSIKEFRYNLTDLHINNTVSNFNPTGTEDSPFYCLDEVLANDLKNPILITLDTNTEYPVSRINSFNGEIYSNNNAKIVCGIGYSEIVIRNSNILFNRIAELCSLNLEMNCNIKTYRCFLKSSNNNWLININRKSVYEAESTFILDREDLNTALFNNIHGRLIWNKGNDTPITSYLPNITKWFIGKVDVLEPIPFFTGTMSKTETKLINNGNIDCFKQFEIRFDDRGDIYIPARNQEYERTFCNLSTDGNGNNVFKQIITKLSNGTLSISKANQISFNASGNITINTDPTINIFNIYAI